MAQSLDQTAKQLGEILLSSGLHLALTQEHKYGAKLARHNFATQCFKSETA
jgi:hypothetical protein